MIVHEDFSVAIAEKLGQISLDLANEGLEGAMLNKSAYEADHPILHFLFLFFLDVVCKDLHASPCKRRYDLTDVKVALIPEATNYSCASAHAEASFGDARFGGIAPHAHSRSPGGILGVGASSMIRAARLTTRDRSACIRCGWLWSIRLHLHRKHQQLVIDNRDVNESLLIYGLRSCLNRREVRFAVLFRIMIDGVDNVMAASHLNGLKHTLVMTHILEDVGLQVAIQDENSASGDVFEGIFIGPDHLHYRLERRL